MCTLKNRSEVYLVTPKLKLMKLNKGITKNIEVCSQIDYINELPEQIICERSLKPSFNKPIIYADDPCIEEENTEVSKKNLMTSLDALPHHETRHIEVSHSAILSLTRVRSLVISHDMVTVEKVISLKASNNSSNTESKRALLVQRNLMKALFE